MQVRLLLYWEEQSLATVRFLDSPSFLAPLFTPQLSEPDIAKLARGLREDHDIVILTFRPSEIPTNVR